LNIKELIREARLNNKLTLVELAEKIGSTHSAISAWENGRSEPAPKYQMKLKEILGIEFNDTVDEPAAVYQRSGGIESLSEAHKNLTVSHIGLTEAMQEMVSIHKDLIKHNTELTNKILDMMGTK
jgi:transcriptional regulator with XRE-family HTH domain